MTLAYHEFKNKVTTKGPKHKHTPLVVKEFSVSATRLYADDLTKKILNDTRKVSAAYH